MNGKDWYRQQTRTVAWQQKRLEMLNLYGWRCEMCGEEDSMLVVHHRHYEEGHKIWQYTHDVFQILCEACHTKWHGSHAIRVKRGVEPAICCECGAEVRNATGYGWTGREYYCGVCWLAHDNSKTTAIELAGALETVTV